jgi:protein required for attachment to host cells
MKRKATRLWALVTDSGYGRLLELDKSPERITEVESREGAARHLTSHELTSDANGRKLTPQRRGGHAMSPRSDAHEEAEVRYVQEWVDRLQEAVSKQQFDGLLLAADPRTLGRLRARMGKALRQAVVAETDRDLTRLPLAALEPRLRALAGWTD